MKQKGYNQKEQVLCQKHKTPKIIQPKKHP